MSTVPSSDEEIARSRPRIRRDVLFTRTPSGVLFHNAHGGFNVVTRHAYRFATLIVPHLDGKRRVEELCAGLGDRQRDMIVQLVRALYARGFARDAAPLPPADVLPAPVAKRFAHQLDYLDHYADDAPGRFLRWRATSVAVLGGDALAHWAALGLLRNGCATVAVTATGADPAGPHDAAGAELDTEVAALAAAGCPPRLDRLTAPAAGAHGWGDLDGWDTVLVTGATAARQLLRLLTEGVPPGRRLLGAWMFGNRAVIGPVMTAATSGCWCCAVLRLGSGADAAASADLWAAVGPATPLGAPPPTPAGPLAGMLGNLLAFEVFRLVTEALPAETRNRLVLQDLDSLDVLAEPLLPHPGCPFCAARVADEPGDGTPPGDRLRAPDADDEPSAPATDAAADDAARAALDALAERDVLVQPAAGVFTEYADDTWEQLPLKIGTVRLGLGPGRLRDISAIDIHHVAGARRTALLRAAEVYTEHVVPAPVLDAVALAAADKRTRVAPTELAGCSGLDVPADQLTAWTQATSLVDGTTVLVPAGAVRTFGGWNAAGLFERSAAGTGAADSPRAALVRALRTALLHDALTAAVRRRGWVHAIDPARLTDDPELLFLLRSADNLGVRAELLHLGGVDGNLLPVALARHVDPGDGAVRWAAGSGLRLRDAVLEALRDLLGAEQLRQAGTRPDTGDPLWADLDAATLVAEETVPFEDARTGWAAVLDGLAAAGRDAYAIPVTAPDLAAGRIHAVRVLLTRGPGHDH